MVNVKKRREKGEDLTIPSVVLQLLSGRELTGYVVDMISGQRGTSVIIKTAIQSDKPRLVYTDFSKIESVSIFQTDRPVKVEPPKAKPVISAPAESRKKVREVVNPPEAPEPTRVAGKVLPQNEKIFAPRSPSNEVKPEADFKKEIIKIQSHLSMCFENGMDVRIKIGIGASDSEPIGALLKTLAQLKKVASDFSAMNNRREEIRNKISQIVFTQSSLPSVSADSGSLIISGNFLSGQSPFLGAEEFASAWEACMF